jgi:hypothetical protein
VVMACEAAAYSQSLVCVANCPPALPPESAP